MTEKRAGARPHFRVIQTDKQTNQVVTIGKGWANVSDNGKAYVRLLLENGSEAAIFGNNDQVSELIAQAAGIVVEYTGPKGRKTGGGGRSGGGFARTGKAAASTGNRPATTANTGQQGDLPF